MDTEYWQRDDIVARLRMEASINQGNAKLCGEAADEIERLRQHRCLWGDDPSGPIFSDEYLESMKALSETVAALPLRRYQPEAK